ncbi:unnamed protein product, partial [Polarella glacialis]
MFIKELCHTVLSESTGILLKSFSSQSGAGLADRYPVADAGRKIKHCRNFSLLGLTRLSWPLRSLSGSAFSLPKPSSNSFFACVVVVAVEIYRQNYMHAQSWDRLREENTLQGFVCSKWAGAFGFTPPYSTPNVPGSRLQQRKQQHQHQQHQQQQHHQQQQQTQQQRQQKQQRQQHQQQQQQQQ